MCFPSLIVSSRFLGVQRCKDVQTLGVDTVICDDLLRGVMATSLTTFARKLNHACVKHIIHAMVQRHHVFAQGAWGVAQAENFLLFYSTPVSISNHLSSPLRGCSALSDFWAFPSASYLSSAMLLFGHRARQSSVTPGASLGLDDGRHVCCAVNGASKMRQSIHATSTKLVLLRSG